MDTQTKTTEEVSFAKPKDNLPATVPTEVERALTAVVAARPRVYPSTVIQAILKVTTAIGHVAKADTNSFQKYKYASWQDVNDKLSPLLAANGLLILQGEKSRSLLEANDQGSILAIVYECVIAHASGESLPPMEWTATARLRDAKGISDDKAAPKCATQAEKYFAMKLFKIRTADEGDLDSDADDGKGRGQPKDEPEQEITEPVAIYVAKGGSKAWHKSFCAAIRKMTTREHLERLGALNAESMKLLEKADAKLYESARAAYALRLTELPKADGAGLAQAEPMGSERAGASKPLPPLVGKAAEQRADAAAAGANPSTGELEDKLPEVLRRMDFAEEQAWLYGVRSSLEAQETIAEIEVLRVAVLNTIARSRISAGAWGNASDMFTQRAREINDKKFDGDTWIKGDLAGALSSAEDPSTLEQVKANVLLPYKDKLSVPQWKTAVRMYRERLDEIDPQNMLAGG